jgi:hypothetical protein
LSRTRILVLAASMLALATAFSACGGGGGSEDPQKVIDEATLQGLESGTLDLELSVKSEGEKGGNLDVSLSGPFEGGGGESLPQLDLAASAKGNLNGKAVDFEGDLTLLSDRAFVGYEGTEYEVDPTTFGFLKSGFEQAQQEGGQESAGTTACQQAAQQLKVGEFVDNLKSEGGAEVDGTKTTKVSGDLSAEGAIGAILELAETPACGAELQAAGGPPLSQLEEAKGQVAKAIKRAHADIYVGEDHIIRRVVAQLTIEENGETVEVNLDVTLGNVNEEQEIKAPSGAKPLEELFQKLGVNPLELIEGASGGGGSGLGGLLEGLGGSSESSAGGSSESSAGGSSLEESQAYIECLQGVETTADLQKCANLAR